MDSETIEGKARPVGTAKVDESRLPARAHPSGPPPATLWRTDDPEEVVKRATKVAEALAPVLKDKGMITQLGKDREHVNIEGWQTLASMVGLVSARPFTVELSWPDDERLTDELRQIRDSGYVFGYDASYVVQTLDGREAGGGEGTCKRTEEAWRKRNGKPVDDYALKGMAQTRAQSRAFASPLRFVVELAGFSGTPAEEVNDAAGPQGGASQAKAERVEPTQKQLNLIKKLVKQHGADEKEAQLIRRFAKARMRGGTGGTASEVIDKLSVKDEKSAKSFARGLWKLADDWQGTSKSKAKPEPEEEEANNGS